jgi:ABC-type sugar transport system substrate-binding protein
VVVIGTDGIKDARDAIMEGRLSATVAQLPYLMGVMAVQTAVKIMRGEAVPLRQDVPLLLLTKQVLEAGVDPLLKYIK